MSQTTKPPQSGFTLIELLIVVAIIGLLSAIAIPQLIHAMQRGRQTRSMADLHTLAQGCEIYQNDAGFYPRLVSATSAELEPVITPHQVGRIPLYDGWQRLFLYQGDTTGQGYTLISLGNNGSADLPYVHGPTSRFRDDIVLSGGVFLQWPEGPQNE